MARQENQFEKRVEVYEKSLLERLLKGDHPVIQNDITADENHQAATEAMLAIPDNDVRRLLARYATQRDSLLSGANVEEGLKVIRDELHNNRFEPHGGKIEIALTSINNTPWRTRGRLAKDLRAIDALARRAEGLPLANQDVIELIDHENPGLLKSWHSRLTE